MENFGGFSLSCILLKVCFNTGYVCLEISALMHREDVTAAYLKINLVYA